MSLGNEVGSPSSCLIIFGGKFSRAEEKSQRSELEGVDYIVGMFRCFDGTILG
jgi:hypothetical protein